MKNKKEFILKWRQLKVEELHVELQELIKQQFKLKMQHVIGELKQLSQIKVIRKNIARILTIIKEKEIQSKVVSL